MIHGNRLMKRSGLHPKSHCKTASYRILINNNNNGATRGTQHTNGAEEELAQDLETVEEYKKNIQTMNENNSESVFSGSFLSVSWAPVCSLYVILGS